MTQVTKNIYNDWVNSNYTNNGNQEITGLRGRQAYQDLKDSVVWYGERIKPIIFQLEIEYQGSNAEPSPQVSGKYYRQIWCPNPPTGCANMNGQRDDIVEWKSTSSTWETVASFDRGKDYIIYEKGQTDDDKGKNWIYDHRADGGEKWIDIGANKINPHNYSSHIQGGAIDQYFHATEEEHNRFPRLANNLFSYMPFIADEVVAYGGTPSISPTVGNHYLIEVGSLGSGLYSLFVGNGTSFVEESVHESLYPLNPVIYAVDKSNYIIDRTSLGGRFFVKQNKNIAVNHNEIQGLQGGTPTERLHISQSMYNGILNMGSNSYYYYIDKVMQVTDTIAHINYLSPALGDYVLLNSESSTTGIKLYKYNGTHWIAQPALDKQYEFYDESTSEVFFYNMITDLIESKGVNKLTYHNWQQGIQGGNVTERYHVDLNTYNQLNATVQESLTIYIDVFGGLDTNTGLSNSSRITSVSKILEILQGYKINELTLDITTTGVTEVTFNIGSTLDEYLIKNNISKFKFINTGTTKNIVSYSGVTISSGDVNATTLPDLKASSVDLASGYFNINNTPFVGDDGINTGTGTDSAKCFIAPNEITNSTGVDINKKAVVVDLSLSAIGYFSYIEVQDLHIRIPNVNIGNILLTNSIIDYNGSFLDNANIVNSILNGVINIYNTSDFNNVVVDGQIYNYGELILRGFVTNSTLINYNLIINDDASNNIIAFYKVDELFYSYKGSVIKLIDVSKMVLINDDGTSILNSNSEGFNNIITFDPINGLQSDNVNTYLVGVSNDILYNSNGTNLDVNIGLLEYSSNKKHISKSNIAITAGTPDVTPAIAHFLINKSVKISLSITNNTNDKHYYKDIYVALNTITANSIAFALSGVDNSSGIVETASMFTIVGDELRLNIDFATNENVDIDIELERTMII